MRIWTRLFGNRSDVSKTGFVPFRNGSYPIDQLRKRREWLFAAVLTHLINEGFPKIKQTFAIDEAVFEQIYDDAYLEMMVGLLASGLVALKEKISEDELHEIVFYFVDLIRLFGAKRGDKELIDSERIIDAFAEYIYVLENPAAFKSLFADRTSRFLSLDRAQFLHFSNLYLVGMGFAYGGDAFHSVDLSNIHNDNRRFRQHLLKQGEFGKIIVAYLENPEASPLSGGQQ
jgi:hypothetical protein